MYHTPSSLCLILPKCFPKWLINLHYHQQGIRVCYPTPPKAEYCQMFYQRSADCECETIFRFHTH